MCSTRSQRSSGRPFSSEGRCPEQSRNKLPNQKSRPAKFQCALSTRSGTECVAHAIHALTDLKLWCLLSEGTAVQVASVLTTMDQLCSKRDAKRESTYPESARPRGGRARLVVLGCEIGGRLCRRGSRFRESVGENEVPQGTPATETVNETRMVLPLEHSVGLQRCRVLRPLTVGCVLACVQLSFELLLTE